MANLTLATTSPSFPQLPDELLLNVLSYLDIPDLLTLSRTSTHLRHLSHDPLLHSSRLHRASSTLERIIPARRSLADLIARRIYITRTTLAARTLGRNLICIQLNRKLSGRPSVERLVDLGVLPVECFGRREGRLAPALVEAKRRIERERVKDRLRGWVADWRERGRREVEKEIEVERADVGRLVRRFASKGEERGRGSGSNWERKLERRDHPARAKVLGLRRFWESVGRDGVHSS